MEQFYQEEIIIKEELAEEQDLWAGINQDDFEQLDIIHLFGKEKLETIQEMISKATGLAFVTVDYKGEPITEPTSFTKFCRVIRSNPEVAMRCKASDAFGAIQAAVTQKPSVYFCPCGLIEVAIPIVLRGHYLGGFIGGQIRCDDAPEEVSQLKKVMPSPASSLSSEEYDNLLQEIPVFSFVKFQDIANLVFLIINQLSENEVGSHLREETIQKKIKKIYASNRKQIAELKKKEEDFLELKVRTNPYMMLDFLTSIVNLSVQENAVKTNELLLQFTDYIRYAYVERGIFTHISKELEHIERYLLMQSQKYGKRLKYSIKIPQGLSMQKIPDGVLMPFVEYAVFYGILQKKEGGRVDITGNVLSGKVMIAIEDDGAGFTDEEADIRFEPFGDDFEGYYIRLGMEVARQKMKRIFKEDFEIITESQKGNGGRCKIIWPENFSERIDS